jgi:hypothetical protein
MKPFNLQEALAGKPVVTRDGRKVSRIIHMPEVADPYNKVLAISDARYMTYSESGEFSLCNPGSVNDLFMVSEKKEGWIAIGRMTQPSATAAFCTHVWATKEQAEAAYMPEGFPFSVQKITWEE